MDRVLFQFDAQGPAAPLPHVWEHTIGSGHAALGLRADWQNQLRRCQKELGVRRVRFHAPLSDDLSTLVPQQKGLLYSFFNIDSVWDFLLSIGMQPFVELSFMPRAIASGRATVFHYAGNVTPPKAMPPWRELIKRFARHAIDRYGADEVRQWNFEVWNEPNLKAFWRGTQSDYFRLYAATTRTLKTVDASLRVGGPATAENGWLEEFLRFCRKSKLSPDFVSTHHYPTDPTKDVSENTEEQLAAGKRGVLSDVALSARAIVGDLPLYYTEWNTSSNERDRLHDEPYAAAFVVKTALDVSTIVDAFAFWTFTDIFDESYFPSVPFHGGFGLLTLHGVAKPAYRAFELLHNFGGERIAAVDGTHPTVDCWVAREGGAICAMLANHALPRHDIGSVTVGLRIRNMRPPKAVTVFRIDNDHANPKRAWLEMGSPEYLSDRQVTQLHEASAMVAEPLDCSPDESVLRCELEIPPHGVAMVRMG